MRIRKSWFLLGLLCILLTVPVFQSMAAGSGTVRINGKAAARTGDALAPHSGSGTITGGSATVRIGG